MTSNHIALQTPEWQKLAGLTLDGGYELQQVLEAEAGRATLRVRVLGDSALRAIARFYTLAGDAAGEQINIWKRLEAMRDSPYLSTPLGSGLLDWEGKALAYAVVRVPDEVLAEGLSERALSGEEARAVMESVLIGLETLHANGLGHGRISPDEVYAIGNSVQISTELSRNLNGQALLEFTPPKYLAPESLSSNVTAAADVWCAGATLFEMLAKKSYSPEYQAEALSLILPFGALEQRCLEVEPEARAKPSEALAILAGKVPVSTSAVEPPAKTAGVILPLPALSPEPAATAEPVVNAEHVPSQPASRLSQERPANRKWIFLAAAAVLILFLFWVLRPHGTRPAAPVPQTATAPAEQPVAPATPQVSPSKPPAAHGATPARVAQTGSPQNPAIWRVVLFTYNREQDAGKKARSLNERHLPLSAEVFSPSGHGSPYLVVAGPRMTRDEAKQARLRLLQDGMPRDSYIQNFTR